jgi:outer membrane receptor protein involved in Fe transport
MNPTIKKTPLHKRPAHRFATWRVLFQCAAVAAITTSSMAQNTPPPPSVSAADESAAEVVRLSPFEVSAEGDRGYFTQQTLVGSRTAKDLLDLSASVRIINSEELRDLNVATLGQALAVGASGVTSNMAMGDGFNMRGFSVETSLRDGITKQTNKSNPMYDIERVEVIKGPASMLLGSNSYLGGAINMITRAATATRTRDVSLTFSTNDYVRLAANISGPLAKTRDTRVNYRITVGGLHGKRDKEVERLDQRFVGAGLAMYFGDRTSVQMNGYLFNDNGYMYYNDFLDISNISSSVTQPVFVHLNQYSTKSFSPSRSRDSFFKNSDGLFNLTFLTRLSENGNLRAFYSFVNIVDRRRMIRAIGVNSDNYTVTRQDMPYTQDRVNHNLQVDYDHHLRLKKCDLDTTIGIDAQNWYGTECSSGITAPPLDTRVPGYFPDDDAYLAAPHPGVGDVPNTNQSKNIRTSLSYYGQENLTFWENRIILIGGWRWFSPGGTSENYKTNVITRVLDNTVSVHKYGIVVKPLPSVAVYFNDSTNQIAQSGSVDKYVNGDKLTPRRAQDGKIKEFGLKWNATFSKDFSAYLSVVHYDMALTNVTTTGYLETGVIGAIMADTESKGWEFDCGMSARLGDGRGDIIAAYSDSRSHAAGDAPELQSINFSPRKYSVLGKYTWTGGALKGWTIGGSLTGESKRRVMAKYYYRNRLPAVINVLVRYSAGTHWSVQLNLDNITNERYIVSVANAALVQTSDLFQPRLEVRYRW